jgi:hypothetical protein
MKTPLLLVTDQHYLNVLAYLLQTPPNDPKKLDFLSRVKENLELREKF